MLIRSNLWVGQYGRFVINPVYLAGGAIVAKLLDFRLFEDVKNTLSRTFCSPKLSLGSWILRCLCDNFPKYPPDIILRTSVIVYLIPQHFLWFKNCKLYWFLLVSGASFASAKTRSVFVKHRSTAHDEEGSQEQIVFFLVAKIFTSSL